jgi:carbamoyltransferase
MHVLGLNAYHGDASAAIFCDGELIAAAEEERFTRIKHCAGFPAQAMRYCLAEAGIKPEELTHIAVARDPKARLNKKALYALKMPRLALDRLAALGKFATIKEDVALALAIDPEKLRAEVHRVEHHKAHLASSFFVSGFDQAALLSVDGLGDFASTMWGVGRGNRMSIGGAIAFPHSLGIYYTAITQYLGFLNYGDEYKVMGLAALGEPEYGDEFGKIVRVAPLHRNDSAHWLGSANSTNPGFKLGLDYFIHHKQGPAMTWREGAPVLGALYSDFLEKRIGPHRAPGASIERRHENIAASLQARLEQAMFSLLNRLYELYRLKKLCLAGGVAFNCVVNGQILERTPFEEVYIPPAAGDAGLAVGAASYVYHHVLNQPRSWVMNHAYWGPRFSQLQLRTAVERSRISDRGFRMAELPQDELVRATATRIAHGNIVGWFHGRMEFGPRALGNRSIVVDPRRPEMKEILNRRIKHRELFRPFAPSILQERIGDYFEQTYASPFMLMTYKVKSAKLREIPAPTHVDGTGRLQTVDQATHPLYWRLIKEFEKLTGVPVVLNTSFNENEPIVCAPAEAIDCFLRTRMDVLVLGSYIIEKLGQEIPIGWGTLPGSGGAGC